MFESVSGSGDVASHCLSELMRLMSSTLLEAKRCQMGVNSSGGDINFVSRSRRV